MPRKYTKKRVVRRRVVRPRRKMVARRRIAAPVVTAESSYVVPRLLNPTSHKPIFTAKTFYTNWTVGATGNSLNANSSIAAPPATFVFSTNMGASPSTNVLSQFTLPQIQSGDMVAYRALYRQYKIKKVTLSFALNSAISSTPAANYGQVTYPRLYVRYMYDDETAVLPITNDVITQMSNVKEFRLESGKAAKYTVYPKVFQDTYIQSGASVGEMKKSGWLDLEDGGVNSTVVHSGVWWYCEFVSPYQTFTIEHTFHLALRDNR